MPSAGKSLCSPGPAHPGARGHPCSSSENSMAPAYASFAFVMSTHGFSILCPHFVSLFKNLAFYFSGGEKNLLKN